MRWQHKGLPWGKITVLSWAIARKKALPSRVCKVVVHR